VNLPNVNASPDPLVLPAVKDSRKVEPATVSPAPGPKFTVVVTPTLHPGDPVWATEVTVTNNSPDTYGATDFVLWVGGSPFLTGSGPTPIPPGTFALINTVTGGTSPGFAPASAFIKVQGVTIWTGTWQMGFFYAITINF
jgi:hypothetical protein